MTLTIKSVRADLFRIPLSEVMSDAKHGDHTHFEVVTATIELSNGLQGVGYTYTGGRGGRAIKALIDWDLGPSLIGEPSENIDALYDEMQWHVHYVVEVVLHRLRYRRLISRCGTCAEKRRTCRCGKWSVAAPVQQKPIVVQSI